MEEFLESAERVNGAGEQSQLLVTARAFCPKGLVPEEVDVEMTLLDREVFRVYGASRRKVARPVTKTSSPAALLLSACCGARRALAGDLRFVFASGDALGGLRVNSELHLLAAAVGGVVLGLIEAAAYRVQFGLL